jgi:anti-sigma factor RsiW
MKKECERTRRQFRRYLRGHVFATERKRIERHLAACPLCATEYQSLRRVDETTQFLKDITPPEGVVQKVKTGVSGLSALKTILYRPLWVVAIIAAAAILYLFVVAPYLREQEREWRELTASAVSPSTPAPAAPPAPPSPAAAPKQQPEQAAAPAPKPADPLVITITVEDEQEAVGRINDVMRGHGVLRTKRFSETVKEISGDLTAKELLTFFSRIETAGRISYSRARLEGFPSTQPLPFVIRLKTAPPRTAQPSEGPAHAPGETSVPKPAENGAQEGAAQTAPPPAGDTPQEQ